MDPMLVSRVSLPILFVAFVFVLMVWPVVRLRRQSGIQAVTLHRDTAKGQRFVAVAFLAFELAAVGFVVIHAWKGPETLGVWPLAGFVTWLGLAIAVAGVLLVAVAQHEMGASFRIGIDDQETALVENGLFAFVRNPIFTGLGILLGGIFLAAPCLWSLALWVGASATVALQTRLEERHLLVMHGEAYRRYASRVGRFIPGIGRFPESQ